MTSEEIKKAIADLEKAIKGFSENPDRLINLIWYLERHYETWRDKWANTPEGFINELLQFSQIE